MRLIVGCGKNTIRQEGDILLDILPFPGIDIVHDLNKEIPFKDNELDEIAAIHVVEHLDSLVNFMNEAWRVLKQGGALYIETPEAGGDPDLQFADPTHVRCYRKHTFINYFTLSEAPKFGYTDKYWAILHLDVKDGNIIFHATPLK